MIGWLRDHPEGVVCEALEANLTTVFRERTHDDCTLVLLARPAPAVGPAVTTDE